MIKRIKKYFITGLIVTVPVFLTIYVLVFAFQFVDRILGCFLEGYLKKVLGFYIPGLGLILFFLIIIFIGYFTNRFIGRKIYPRLERWFAGLPLIDKIYPTLKKLVLFILQQKEFGFKKVVLVEYPSKGIWSIGFLTNEEFSKLGEVSEKGMVSVFVPNTPGPVTGYVIFVPKEALRFVDISVADAIKIILSGGVFKP